MITTRKDKLVASALAIAFFAAMPQAGAWQRPAKVARAEEHLRASRAQLRLGPEAAFVARHELPTSDGRTIVRFRQMHLGHRIWGAETIAHVDNDGRVSVVDDSVARGVSVNGTPRLSADEATRIALLDLRPQGELAAAPVVEQVVFPSRHTSGLVTRFDPQTGHLVIDRALSTFAKPPSEPYVWAWEVKTFLYNASDGHSEVAYVVDATSGAILRKWDERWADRPAQGTGHSFYRGQVALSTTQADDGTYSLRAQDRGSTPQPRLAGAGITQIGLATYYAALDLKFGFPTVRPYAGHATNDWGTGTVPPVAYSGGVTLFEYDANQTLAWLHGATSPNGETYAVDAHYGLSRAWDFYHDVFNRNGIDGKGTSTMAIVHYINGKTTTNGIPMVDNAMWSPALFGMEFGEGTYPQIANGLASTTEIDITGHELTHGVSNADVDFLHSGLAAAISEATSDIFGKMIQAWVDGGGTGATIPDFAHDDPTRWQVGLLSRPSGPIRYLYQPSLDGVSADGWYQGIEMLDAHSGGGPVNRFFFFLAQGASADPNSATHSVFLPSGMSGIGNDHAARIWYKTVTEYLTPDANFEVARDASARAAGELYGAGSAEQTAVLNAWAAVNVGAAPGAPEPVRVSFPVVHGPNTYLGETLLSTISRVQIFPSRARVFIHCDVSNTTDRRVDITIGSPITGDSGGVVNDDGSWTTPAFQYHGDEIPVTATSKADPRQFARGFVQLVELDSDNDGETDAMDLGNVATLWGLTGRIPDDNACVFCGLTPGPQINDWDVQFFNEAFVNAWAAPRL
jgi:Zn-dependent metalloprotease